MSLYELVYSYIFIMSVLLLTTGVRVIYGKEDLKFLKRNVIVNVFWIIFIVIFLINIIYDLFKKPKNSGWLK